MNRPPIRDVLVAAGAAALISVTLFSQHPNRLFDRFRSKDKIGFWLPNWRFFAPEPAQHDFHVLHRTLSVTGVESKWTETHHVTPRKVIHFVWFPGRRIDKGIFDVTAELVATIPSGPDAVVASPAYRALAAFVLKHIRDVSTEALAGYQFMLASSHGYDESVEPEEILSSPFIPMEQA